MNFNVVKATLKIRDNYIILKNKGHLQVEMVPLVVHPTDSSKKTINQRDRLSAWLQPEAIYALLNEKSTQILCKKDSDAYEVSTVDRADEWEWTITKNFNSDTKRVVIMNKVERFMVQEFIKYSLPYVQGWFAIGDNRIAEQSMISSPEGKDTFENI